MSYRIALQHGKLVYCKKTAEEFFCNNGLVYTDRLIRIGAVMRGVMRVSQYEQRSICIRRDSGFKPSPHPHIYELKISQFLEFLVYQYRALTL